MKNIKYLFALLFIVPLFTTAQNMNDALRFSQAFHGGTARSMSMGGAFSALGADMSAMSFNPAGIALYRSSEVTVTPCFYTDKSEATFLQPGRLTSDNEYDFNLSNIGLVSPILSGSDAGWVSINFGVAYNKRNNFNQNMIIDGTNNSNSLADYFMYNANGVDINSLSDVAEGIAYDAYVIDRYDTISNLYGNPYNAYGNNIDNPTYGQRQRKIINTSGGIGEYAFSIAANYAHQLYIGCTFGIQDLNYEMHSTFMEDDENDVINDFKSFEFSESQKATGSGFNFKVGAIYRPLDWVRIGAAVHTPTFWDIDREYSSEITSNFAVADNDGATSYTAQSDIWDFDYEVTSPMRAMLGAAFVIQKMAIISFDYEFVDYGAMRMRSDGYDFYEDNTAIPESYAAANNIRAGLEYRLGNVSLRGGYAYYGSPYKSTDDIEPATRQSISGGFGVANQNFYLDLAYVYNIYSHTHLFYDVYQNEQLAGANINTNYNQILATFGIRF